MREKKFVYSDHFKGDKGTISLDLLNILISTKSSSVEPLISDHPLDTQRRHPYSHFVKFYD
jgi:hypothetical protein